MEQIIEESESINDKIEIDTDYEINVEELNFIRDKIEMMNKFNQVGVLRILKKNNTVLNENKYGVHINLSELQRVIIDELLIYIKYVNSQELSLSEFEDQKNSYKNIYFAKDNKDIAGKYSKNNNYHGIHTT